MPFFFIFFCSTFWSDNIKKKVFRLLVLIKSVRLFCRHFYFYSPLFFPWEEEDEGRFTIIFGRLSCVSIVTRARLERTKEEEALTHLSTERERERERGATDDHHRDCFCGALCVLLFFGGGSSILVVVDSFAAAKGVALTTSRSETASPSFLPFARARALDLSERKTPPAVAGSRARLVIDASLKPSVFRLCARAHTRERDRERQRETEDKERLV